MIVDPGANPAASELSLVETDPGLNGQALSILAAMMKCRWSGVLSPFQHAHINSKRVQQPNPPTSPETLVSQNFFGKTSKGFFEPLDLHSAHLGDDLERIISV